MLNQRKCIILRGLPGCGKNHYLQEMTALQACRERAGQTVSIFKGAFAVPPVVVSADDHFTASDGSYRFVAAEIAEAHNRCMLNFLRAIIVERAQLVVVNNTNITAHEISPYRQVAVAHDYEVEIVQIDATIEDCVARRSSGDNAVPAHVIGAMAEAMRREILPPYWGAVTHMYGKKPQ